MALKFETSGVKMYFFFIPIDSNLIFIPIDSNIILFQLTQK